jgi:hypothetical protein
MTALARAYSNIDSGSFLPVPVVVEFGLNNINPPPDMIEEEQTSKPLPKLKNQKQPRLAKATQNET